MGINCSNEGMALLIRPGSVFTSLATLLLLLMFLLLLLISSSSLLMHISSWSPKGVEADSLVKEALLDIAGPRTCVVAVGSGSVDCRGDLCVTVVDVSVFCVADVVGLSGVLLKFASIVDLLLGAFLL